MKINLTAWWAKLNQLVKQAVIIAVCIALNVASFFTIYKAADYRAYKEYQKPFRQADSVMESLIYRPYTHLSKFRTQILQNQYSFLQRKKDFYEMRLVRFYVAYISVVGCSLIMTIILAGLLAFIANHGWASTSQNTRFLFVTIALFATLYASILAVFNLEENGLNNLKLFNEHKNVQIDIYNYLTTSGRLMTTDSSSVYAKTDTMIYDVNQKMMALNRVFYTINQSYINEISMDAYLSKAGVSNNARLSEGPTSK